MRDSPEARTYHRWQFRIGALRFLVSAGAVSALLLTRLSIRLRDLLAAWTLHWWVAVPIAALLIRLRLHLITLPLSLIRGFFLPPRYCLLPPPFCRRSLHSVNEA